MWILYWPRFLKRLKFHFNWLQFNFDIFCTGALMVFVILVSRKLKINPDNIATPIAASLGDLTTLSLLSGVSMLLYQAIGTQVWLAPTIIAVFLVLTPLWVYISVKNHYTNDVIYSGWTPVLSAMVISRSVGIHVQFVTVCTFICLS